MISKGKGNTSGVVLVVDPHTSKILSSCLRMHDLLNAGVLVLQNLCLHREKLRDVPAVYFIQPTEEAIELLIEDFPKPPTPPTANSQAANEKHSGMVASALAALHIAKHTDSHSSSSHSGGPNGASSTTAKPAQSQYHSAHLFFSSPVPPEQMEQIQQSNMDLKKIKSFVELNIDFLAFESRVFHFDSPHWSGTHSAPSTGNINTSEPKRDCMLTR